MAMEEMAQIDGTILSGVRAENFDGCGIAAGL